MRCPECGTASLQQRSSNADVVEMCQSCKGVWLEMGQIDEFVADPRAIENHLLNLPE